MPKSKNYSKATIQNAWTIATVSYKKYQMLESCFLHMKNNGNISWSFINFPHYFFLMCFFFTQARHTNYVINVCTSTSLENGNRAVEWQPKERFYELLMIYFEMVTIFLLFFFLSFIKCVLHVKHLLLFYVFYFIVLILKKVDPCYFEWLAFLRIYVLIWKFFAIPSNGEYFLYFCPSFC